MNSTAAGLMFATQWCIDRNLPFFEQDYYDAYKFGVNAYYQSNRKGTN